MTTETEIVNAALRKGGAAKRISALTDAVGSAGIAQDVYTTERDNLLRSGVWNFAVTRIQLAALTAVPAFEYQHAFAVPSECLRIVSISDNDAGDGIVEYKLESVLQGDGSYLNCIVTNSNVVFLRYCRLVTEPSLMSSSFVQVLILLLARIFAIAIAKSNSLYAALGEELKEAQRGAKSIDGIEDFPERLPEGSWARSRGAWGWSNGNRWPGRN